MLSVKDDLLITTTLVGTIAVLFAWKRKFLIDFLIRREEHQARQNNPRQSKIGTRHSTSSEVLSNILINNNNNKSTNQNNQISENNNTTASNKNNYQLFATTLARGKPQKEVISSFASAASENSSSSSSIPLTVGSNDGSAFGIVDRIPSLFGNTDQEQQNKSMLMRKSEEKRNFSKYNLLLPVGTTSALLLMKGFDVTESFAPSVPHNRNPSSKLRGAGPLGALLYPFFHNQQQQNLKNQNSTQQSDPELVVDAIALQQQYDQERHYNSNKNDVFASSSSSINNSKSSWVDALLLASANVTSRGGQRSSDDIERAIESLIFAKRRRQAFDAFTNDKDVPLKPELYDQLLRTFLTDRDHVFSILTAMEVHGIYQGVLKSGERNSLAQVIFEVLSLHDYERALSAFNIHHGSYLKKKKNSNSSTHSSPVYSGLIAALIKRGMKKEASNVISALKNSDETAQKDIATGLIRCLHNEFELNLASNTTNTNSSSKPKRITDALEFTQEWLKSYHQNSINEKSNFIQTSLQKSKIGLHARVACSVFGQNPNPLTCSALSRFLLQHYPNGSTPVLQSAISYSLFPSSNSASSSMKQSTTNTPQQLQVNNNNANALVASSSASALHFARLSVSRGIARRGNWQLALSMAQQCLKSKTFEPVGPLAATVAKNGKWSAALRLGTQLFALRRAPPTAHELSLCVHSSLWSGRWSSALFWVERAHSRGLKFESPVYDAAFAAAAAAAAASASNRKQSNFDENNTNNGNFQQDFIPNENSSKITRHNFEAAIRTVQCMAEMGGQCSGQSIEKLIASAAKMENGNNNHSRKNEVSTISSSSSSSSESQEEQSEKKTSTKKQQQQEQTEGAPKIIDVLCDSGIVDWKL